MLKRTSWLLLSIALLVSSVSLVKIGTAPVTPTIFLDPDTTIGDLTPAPGSIITMQVNVSDVPDPGLWGYEFYMNMSTDVFPPVYPISNGNFTTDATGWSTTVSGTAGTVTYGYDAADGNPSPGSGPGSYYVRANSTGTGSSRTFLTQQTFTWSVGAPVEALLSYAWRVTGNSIDPTLSTSRNSFGIRVISPLGNTRTLISTIAFNAVRPWTYTMTSTSASSFDQVGTYTFIVRVLLRTAATGANDYVQVNFDDLGLRLAPVSVTEGSFLQSQPPVQPISNMNFTSDATGWTTTTSETSGTSTYGWVASGGNTNGSGGGNYRHRATSTVSQTALIEFYTRQINFSWTRGEPSSATLSFAYNISGTSIADWNPSQNNTVQVRLQNPLGTWTTLMSTQFNKTEVWRYSRGYSVATSFFTESGNYTLEFGSVLKTAAVGTGSYVQVNWDDVGLELQTGGGGATFFTSKYFTSDGGYLYVANSMTGTPYVDSTPVIGSGNLATVKVLVGYGGSWFDLRDTVLLTLGPAPSYPPTPMTHNAVDGFFKNKLTGDANGAVPYVVNSLDLGTLNGHWAPSEGTPGWSLGYDRVIDCNDDGYINSLDLGVVNGNWGRTYP